MSLVGTYLLAEVKHRANPNARNASSSGDTVAASNSPGAMLRSSLHQSLDMHTRIFAGFVLYWSLR